MLPLRLGDPGAFAAVRDLCQAAGFTPAGLCQILGLESLSDLPRVGQAQRERVAAAAGALAVLARLFLLGLPVPAGEVAAAVGPAGLDALQRLDLLRPGGAGAGGACLATVALYPVAGLLIASDRVFNPDGTPHAPPADLVFAAISPGTLQFLRLISRAPARAALDLCTGSGVAALLLSQTAEQVAAVDITDRSAHFARFNAQLNGCGNVEVMAGDLYQPVGGRRFDRIVAHPPYAPALADPQIWRDGGSSGEAVLQGIVAGLPQHLLPGGTFCTLAVGMDMGQQPFEQRLRGWLGAAQGEFDLLFAVEREWTPRQLAADLAARHDSGEAALIARWREHLTGLGMSRAAYGALALRRRAAGEAPPAAAGVVLAQRIGGDPLTLRTRLSPATDGAAIDRTFAWHRRLLSPAAAPELAAAVPRLSPHLQVKVTHGVREGELVPLEFLLEADQPFQTAIRAEPWLVSALLRCDGSRSIAALYQEAHSSAALPAGFQLDDFAALMAVLVLNGVLEASADQGAP